MARFELLQALMMGTFGPLPLSLSLLALSFEGLDTELLAAFGMESAYSHLEKLNLFEEKKSQRNSTRFTLHNAYF